MILPLKNNCTCSLKALVGYFLLHHHFYDQVQDTARLNNDCQRSESLPPWGELLPMKELLSLVYCVGYWSWQDKSCGKVCS